MLVEQSLQERFRSPKACAFQVAYCIGEVNQAAPGSKIEKAERTGDAKPLLFSGAYAPAVVD